MYVGAPSLTHTLLKNARNSSYVNPHCVLYVVCMYAKFNAMMPV
jgi:hypothetical protein